MISKGKASSSKLPKAQELSSHFKFHFLEENGHVSTRIFYNYLSHPRIN
jgi:hypothetical protein